LSELFYTLVADVIALSHGFIIVALSSQLIFGTILRRKLPVWWTVSLIPAIAMAAWGYIFLKDCPINPIERYFRNLAGQEFYNGSFIGHYLVKVGIDVHPIILEATIGVVLGFLLLDMLSRKWTRRKN